jgi:hypothetical protein
VTLRSCGCRVSSCHGGICLAVESAGGYELRCSSGFTSGKECTTSPPRGPRTASTPYERYIQVFRSARSDPLIGDADDGLCAPGQFRCPNHFSPADNEQTHEGVSAAQGSEGRTRAGAGDRCTSRRPASNAKLGGTAILLIHTKSCRRSTPRTEPPAFSGGSEPIFTCSNHG